MSTLRERFQAATKHPQLSQDKVAREVCLLLRDFQHPGGITPPRLITAASLIGMGPRNYETGQMLATWLLNDGWIQTAVRPYAGKGIGACLAYEVSPKWKELLVLP